MSDKHKKLIEHRKKMDAVEKIMFAPFKYKKCILSISQWLKK